MNFKTNFKGIDPVNGSAVYGVKAGDVEVFEIVLTEVEGVEYHPVVVRREGLMLTTKSFTKVVEDHKGRRFSTGAVRNLVARYGHHYIAQLFTGTDHTGYEYVAPVAPAWTDEDDDQDEIDEDGAYGL